MSLARRVSETACLDCGRLFDYETYEEPDLCPSCDLKESVIADAKHFAKQRNLGRSPDVNDYMTYHPPLTAEMSTDDQLLYVFHAEGHTRVVRWMTSSETWAVIQVDLEDKNGA